MADVKTCPKCFETVPAAAVTCRACRADLNPLTPWFNGVRNFGCAALIVMTFAWCATVNREGEERRARDEAERAAVPGMSEQQRQQCSQSLSNMVARGGLVEVSGTTMRIHRHYWAQLQSNDQAALLALLACHAFGRPASKLLDDQNVVIRDAATGETIAFAGGGMASY